MPVAVEERRALMAAPVIIADLCSQAIVAVRPRANANRSRYRRSARRKACRRKAASPLRPTVFRIMGPITPTLDCHGSPKPSAQDLAHSSREHQCVTNPHAGTKIFARVSGRFFVDMLPPISAARASARILRLAERLRSTSPFSASLPEPPDRPRRTYRATEGKTATPEEAMGHSFLPEPTTSDSYVS